jgi:hypothetical protein
VLGIVYGTISGYVLKKARLARASGATGAVTLIQRFGSALNLNVHFHMLMLDGAHLAGTEPPVFRRIAPPVDAELQALVERLADLLGHGSDMASDNLHSECIRLQAHASASPTLCAEARARISRTTTSQSESWASCSSR